MKKFTGTIALSIILLGHVAARLMMPDSFTFSKSDYSVDELNQMESNLPIPSSYKQTTYSIAPAQNFSFATLQSSLTSGIASVNKDLNF